VGNLEGSCAGIADQARFAGERADKGAQAFYVFRHAYYRQCPHGIVRCPPLVTPQGGKGSEPKSGREARPHVLDVANAPVILLEVERPAEPEGRRPQPVVRIR
jgi:hypothetical protein